MATKKSTDKRLLVLVVAGFLLGVILASTSSDVRGLVTGLIPMEDRTVDKKWRDVGEVYATEWKYTTPSGREDRIDFTIVLKDGVIEAVEVQPYTESEVSQEYQTGFAKEITQVVMGMRLEEVDGIDVVSGASGTTQNFKDAVAALASEMI